MPLYSVFGLTVESALELPLDELVPLAVGQTPDVTVQIQDALGNPDLSGGIPRSIDITPAAITLTWADIGRYSIRDGKRIEIQPQPRVPRHVLSLFVTGTAFAMLLYQRGYTVLHGSAVAIGGCGVGFLGDKGAGKSTLAMSMRLIDGILLADDLVAVQPGPELTVMPGFRQMKLWPDALTAFGYQADELARLRPEVEKRGLRFPQPDAPKPASLCHLFVIQPGREIEIVPLSARDALLALLPQWYPARFGTDVVRGLQAQATQFMQCVSLVRHTRISLLRRPLALSALPSVAEAVYRHVTTAVSHSRPWTHAVETVDPAVQLHTRESR